MAGEQTLTPARRLEEWRRWEAELQAGEASAVPRGPLFEELCTAGAAFRKQSYSPYSKLALGALLLGVDGVLYPGVNVENASFGLTNCAERSAVFTAVTVGQRRFHLCFLQGQEPEPIAPCGACRQVLHEFSPHLWVVSRGSSGRLMVMRVDQLLPGAMGARDLPGA
jgi:cytidine deaminase